MPSFIAAHGITNAHLQTLLPRLFRRKPLLSPHWQTIDTPDGDFLDLVWSEDYRQLESLTKPVFVLFHGLEGSFFSPYAHGLMNAFAKQGWLSVMMHFRGCSGRPNNLARAYHSGETGDARQVLEYVRERCPNRPIIATGVSLGGNMLVNYLAQYNDDPIVSGATIISAPLELGACSQRIERGFSRLYRNYLLSSLKNTALLKHQKMKEALGITAAQIKQVTRLIDFDDLITAPLHGFRDAQDYYQRCSGLQRLPDITIPTRLIQAQDDPFMTDEIIPTFTLPKNLDYQLTEHGGHVGFITGSWNQPKMWLEETLPQYYQEYL
ncbi:hydrolase [Vibrio sp. CAIM 722]|uniref:Hydrolase n=1 Tax=Vibrio eleionomae TaxID=2653505 RepID=A0A7X4RTK7_9VIBR|nr:hydrolase [Vibrio eleionomae]MZI92317.1 hydrolase [Vibrio eleionomae]